MPEYKEISESISIPKGTGIAGYIETIKKILKKPRVQEVTLKTNGYIGYRRFALENEPEDSIGMNFEDLMPYSILRGADIEELQIASDSAAVAVAHLFSRTASEGLNPILFAGGSSSNFWEWHKDSTGVDLGKESIYGLPYYPDPEIPNETLLLCAAYARDAALVDVKKSYKISIPLTVVR